MKIKAIAKKVRSLFKTRPAKNPKAKTVAKK